MSTNAEINNQSVTSKTEMLAIRLAEVTDVKTIKKWVGRAAKSMSKSSASILQFGSFGSECRYFEAWIEGKEAGYIRITNRSGLYKDSADFDVWHAAETYVDAEFPAVVVSWALMNFVIQNHGVKTTLIHADDYENNKENIYSLGFRHGAVLRDFPEIYMLMTEDIGKHVSSSGAGMC